ncbi:MAG TPA: DHA2 family efflux MFS transporter permease subunit [Candidatus Dormibacteraeota bacterium]|nr:DHA2 family efflux MFS transporter permease subunit [Candidatus Dormibacteraeota bacterium]
MSRRWLVLLVVSAGSFMVFLDGTIVNITFPAIRRTFPDASIATLSWVLNAYTIVFASLLLTSGRVADLVGRRRVFFLGMLVFLAGSALSGAAPTDSVLIAARAVQAIGASLILPTSVALILAEFPATMRATAVGIWGGIGAVAAASGPSLGGIITYQIDWRWAFYVNLPIGLAVWLIGRRLLREARDETATGWPDALGVALVTIAVGALSLGIVEGTDWGWTDPRIVGAFALTAVLAPIVVLRAARHSSPVIDLSLFRVRSFAVANLANVIFATAFTSMLLAGVLYLTSVWHFSILIAGLGSSPGPLFAAAFAPIAGRLADRFGHRAVLVPGAIIFSIGIVLFLTRVTTTPDYFRVWLVAACFTGTGVGLTLPTLGSAAAASLPPRRFAAGSAVSNTSRQVGSVLGISILVVILGDVTRHATLAAFRRGWLMMLGLSLTTAIVCATMGRTQGATAAAAPAPPPVTVAGRPT